MIVALRIGIPEMYRTRYFVAISARESIGFDEVDSKSSDGVGVVTGTSCFPFFQPAWLFREH
jgi:hypothetical protein